MIKIDGIPCLRWRPWSLPEGQIAQSPKVFSIPKDELTRWPVAARKTFDVDGQPFCVQGDAIDSCGGLGRFLPPW